MSSVRSIKRAREQRKDKAAVAAGIDPTLLQLVISQGALSGLASQPLPAKQAFALGKLIRAVGEELKAYDETRLKLLEQYGEKAEDGSRYDFPDAEKRETFEAEHKSLLETAVHLPGARVKLAVLDGISISAADIATLDWLICEGCEGCDC